MLTRSVACENQRLPVLFAIALLLAVGAEALQAQPARGAAGSRAYAMADAVRSAVERNPAVRGAESGVLEAGEGIAAARAGYQPQVRGGVGARLRARPALGGSRGVPQATLSVSQMLYDFGKVAGEVAEAEASVLAERARLALAVDDLAREAAQAWVEVHRYRELEQIAAEQVQGVRAIAGLVDERHRKGASNRADVAQARSRVSGAQAQQLNAAAQVQRWRQALARLLDSVEPVDIQGDEPGVLGQACGAMPPASASLPVPALELARAERDVAGRRVQRADAVRKPTLSLEGSLDQRLDGRRSVGTDRSTDWSVGIHFTAPLYEGGRNNAEWRAAGHALTAADADLESAQLQHRRRLDDARTQAADFAGTLPLQAERVVSLRDTRNLYREQYLQLGTRSLLDLLNAEQELHSARSEEVQSRHELQRVQLDCLYETGRLREVFHLARPLPGAVRPQP